MSITPIRPGITGSEGGSNGGDGGGMETRLTKLETRLETIIPTLATKSDVAELKALVADSRSDVVKFIGQFGIGCLAVGLAILIFAINRASPASSQPSQPVVIYPPPAPAPQVAPNGPVSQPPVATKPKAP